jgi:adenine-specific DNA-methyltransferase
MNPTLFPDMVVDCPYTEGIKYTGSKLKLLPYIIQLAQKIRPRTIFDGFSGTTRISQAFARLGYKVVTNDIAVWSKVFANCYLKVKKNDEYYQKIIDHMNSLPGKDGWFTENYGGAPNSGKSVQKDGLKKLWQFHNTRKLDAIREEIDNLGLNEIDKAILLTSLILALDEVDNTLGHYAAYLSEWSPRSYNTMKMRLPSIIRSPQNHIVYNEDIFNVLDKVVADLAYYDPPYGSNNDKMPPSRVRYAAYYHIWTTICLNDKPQLFGKAKRRIDSSDKFASSVFEEYKKGTSGRFVVVEAIEKLIKMSRTKYIILSYSSGGRATAEELEEVLGTYGNILEIISIDYRKNVMANMRWTNNWIRDIESPNKEYLFLIENRKQI